MTPTLLLLTSTLLTALPPTYTTRAGDTCYSVTNKFYGDVPGAIAHLHADNPTMGPAPHRVLAAGTVLKLSPMPTGAPPVTSARDEEAPPPKPLPAQPASAGQPDSDATLTFLVPQVERRPAAVPSWSEANLNELLYRLDQVSTRQGAGAELTFKDTSRLQMHENALIVVLGPEKKGPVERKGSGFELINGELSVAMAELRKTPMPVVLPGGATVSTQSRDALMSVDPQAMSRICMYDGAATVSAQGRTVKLKTNEGTRVAKGKAPEAPRPLPPQLGWSSESPVVVLTADPEATVELDVPVPSAGAKARLQVASDDGFRAIGIDDASTQPNRTLKLKPGHYVARVSAVDSAGLQGRPSSAKAIDVIALRGANEHRAVVPEALDATLPAGVALYDNGREVKAPWLMVTPGRHVVTLRTLGDRSIVSTVYVDVGLPQPTVTAQPSGDGARVSALFDHDIVGLPLRWVDSSTGQVLTEAKPVTREVAAVVEAGPGATGTAELQFDGVGFASVPWRSGALAPKGVKSTSETPPAPIVASADPSPCATPYLLNHSGLGDAPWAYLDDRGCRSFELASTLGVSAAGTLQSALAATASASIPKLDALRVQLAARTMLTGADVAKQVQVDVGVSYQFKLHERFSLGVAADLGGTVGHSRFSWVELSGGWGLAHVTSLDNLRNSGFFEIALPIGEYFHLQAHANVDVPFTHMNRFKFELAPGLSFHWRWLRISLAATVPTGWVADGDPYRLLGGQLTVGYLQTP